MLKLFIGLYNNKIVINTNEISAAEEFTKENFLLFLESEGLELEDTEELPDEITLLEMNNSEEYYISGGVEQFL